MIIQHNANCDDENWTSFQFSIYVNSINEQNIISYRIQ